MKQSYYSHGKLLITGEYLVLDGVIALAIPTKKGQWLHLEENNTNQITWKSLDEKENIWFNTILDIKDKSIECTETDSNKNDVINTLINILTSARALNPDFLSKNNGYTATTTLEFNREWGLGSSSTLINNIAQWAQVDAFKLLENSFGGSGYDIACAQHHTPILYKRSGSKPSVKEISFNPIYKDSLYFVHLNQKQDSKESIKHYQSLPLKDFDKAEITVNDITTQILDCTTIETFEKLIEEHEQIISSMIKTPTIKSRLFPDYPRSIKSLGGWGGDFILTTGNTKDIEYFKNKGYHTIIPYKEMIVDDTKDY